MSDLKGADVIELRQRRSWSQEDLASILGVSNSFVSYLEHGDESFMNSVEDKLILLGAIPGAGRDLPLLATPAAESTPVEEAQTPPIERTVRVDDGIRRVSNSEIQTYKECRRKWWLGWHRGLALKKPPAVGPAMIGSRIHSAFEAMYDVGGPYYERGMVTLEAIIDHDRTAVASYDEVTRKQFEDESNLERIMIEGYVQWAQETGADENIEVVATEQYVETSLQPFAHYGGLKIIGKLDVIIRQLSDGALRFIDHKTVGSISQITKRLRSNEQFKHYQLLHWLTQPADSRVGGVIVNMLRRVKRTAKANPPFYAREEITHGRPAMEVYYDRLVAEIWRILNTENELSSGISHQEAVPPTFSLKCDWGCPFVNVCDMFDDGSRVEDAIAAQYEVVDPLSYYDKSKEEIAE